MTAVVALGLKGLIHGYRYAISPLIGPSCRFAPSCSSYALEAISRHGPWGGSWLALKRLVRCHPWHPGVFDPVPPPRGLAAPVCYDIRF